MIDDRELTLDPESKSQQNSEGQFTETLNGNDYSNKGQNHEENNPKNSLSEEQKSATATAIASNIIPLPYAKYSGKNFFKRYVIYIFF